MISPSEAHRLILNAARLFPVETIPLTKAVGRVLREDIKSDRDQPPFSKSLMDGIAVSYEAWIKGQRKFNIEAVVAAGVSPKPLKKPSGCVRIMTGAVVPKGCDCVVPVEQVQVDENFALCKDWTMIKKHQFIRSQASDGKKGDILLKSGRRLWAPHIGIAAGVGKSRIKVSRLPAIAVVATGDELVDIHRLVKPYQTRLSNSYALQALLDQAQLGEVKIFHLRDNEKLMRQGIKDILGKFDCMILSGGVSMGEFDYVPRVLEQLGIKQSFHKVSQKPGKPFWFGVSKNGKAIFALPGNPVSTQICAYRYVIPYLKKTVGLEVKQEFISVLDKVNIQSDLTHFLPVAQGHLVAISGSGDFAALGEADGFIEYESYKSQTLWPYFSWRV
ncbi:MAG: molybdopterin molybdotransferase MoeA [Candidatus Omnitrophica bacterium]|nr:molybdopterin molybdotransferase MoeA [Candidatus Omnitrophota bacterium]MDE2009702.1 molybdopterin molybdotransferase MoeA [Candidatus Omnitrophota bacterium]